MKQSFCRFDPFPGAGLSSDEPPGFFSEWEKFSPRYCLPSPTPGMPALLETMVKFPRSLRSRRPLIKVAGTPERPNPPTRIVDPLRTLLIASSALGEILSILRRQDETENSRLPVNDCRHCETRRVGLYIPSVSCYTATWLVW